MFVCLCGKPADYNLFVNVNKLNGEEVKSMFPLENVAQNVMDMFIHYNHIPFSPVCFKCCSTIIAHNAEDNERKFSLQLVSRFWERLACTG